MPIAAVVDGRIFCTHGGIPEERKYENLGFKQAVNAIPCPLPDPENQSPLAWDLMWADPARETDVNEESKSLLFLENTRRKKLIHYQHFIFTVEFLKGAFLNCAFEA